VRTSRFYRRTAQVVCGLLLVVIVSGCSFLSGINGTESSLQGAGYQDVDVNIASLDAVSATHAVSIPRWALGAGLAALLAGAAIIAALVIRSRRRRPPAHQFGVPWPEQPRPPTHQDGPE
jgi:hypothetical protein